MNFDERLKLYSEGGMITDKDVQMVNDTVEMFRKEYGIELTEENAGMFIAHLCAALGRNATKEEVPPVSEDMLKELTALDTYPKSLEILNRLMEITDQSLNKTEQDYALLHINNVLGNIKGQ